MNVLGLEAAWEALEGGATLARACQEADVRGAARGQLIGELRRLLSCEARLDRLLPGVRSPQNRLIALRVLGSETVSERELERAGIAPAALRAKEAQLLERGDAIQRLAQSGSVTLPVAEALHSCLGQEAGAFLSASWQPAPTMLRTNVARTTPEALRARLAEEGLATEPGRFSPWALVVTTPGPLPKTKAFEEGLFEVQDEASQLVARFVDPPKGAPTIDACAGAGGKTLALCALLGKGGRVVALDVSEKRLAELRRRAARAQAFNLLVRALPRTEQPLDAALTDLEGRAARVLIDAPCSGIGALRRKPDVARRIDAALLARLPEQQLEIARSALRWLRPGGHLVYATCTPFTAENEGVVARLVEEEGLVPLPLRAWLPPDLTALADDLESPVLRLLPHKHGTDAFTVHVLERTER